MKWISFFVVALVCLLLPLVVSATDLSFTNVCPDRSVEYCKNVDRIAHNNKTNPPLARGIKLGKIVGVAWKRKGGIIGISEAIPAAGISESVRTSPRDAFYYIIDDGSGRPFLRQCREIDAK
jgi:hypothetical protein